MRVRIDDSPRGLLTFYASEKNSHKALLPDYLVVPVLLAGSHTISLTEMDDTDCGTAFELDSDFCTMTDAFDRFHVSVIEIPG